MTVTSSVTAVWTWEEGSNFLRRLSSYVRRAGYEVALTGSILKQGTSSKDIDVILYPLSTKRKDMKALKSALNRAGLVLVRTREQVRTGWNSLGFLDTKHVEEWAYQGKRVDLFFLS